MNKQPTLATSKVTMDARKLLSTINQGYAGQISVMENRLQKLGTELDRKFRLVSLANNALMFEDIKSNNYYRADYKIAEHQITLENIKQIVIVDEKKPEIFNKACHELVEAIEDDDSSKADKIFGQIEKGYCTPNVIPESGIVKTRDGVVQHINISESIISESIYPVLVKTIKDSITSAKMVIKEGVITYNDQNVKLPVSKLTLRQVNARHMRNVAESAYQSDNFGKLIKACAAHISNNNVREAIKLSKDFLAEEQEFTLLNKGEFNTLIENTLFSNGIFNSKIVEDTSNTLWETSCFVNKDAILKEWKIAADDTKSKNLIENVKLLEEVSGNPKRFSEAYDSFIKSVLVEDMSSKAVKAQAYLNMLKLVKNVVSGSDADAAIQGAVDDLVVRLESDINNIDDATLYEVEDLLATVGSDLITDVQTLGDFDKIPEPQAVDQFGAPSDIEGEFAGDMGEFTAPSVGGAGGMGEAGATADMGAPTADMGAPASAPGAEAGAEVVPEPIPGGTEEEEEEPVLDSKKVDGKTINENSDYKTPKVDENLKVNESYGEGEKPWEKNKKEDKKVEDKKDEKDEKKVEESLVAVANSDEKLIEIVSAAMNADNKTDGGEEIKKADPAPAADKPEGELIQDCDNPVVKEDSNITDPENKNYAGHQDDKKDHEGVKRNNPPKFSDEDFNGTEKAKTGKEKPETGLTSATKE
jgi:hypothetical protein